ncbi:hypothetical protein Clacol_003113 [Clathrus columnatus]|uniref:Uncharacterized protein n=1 Tax=Clathrus columnatus TaxID=1419009 RepID=A0AAV5A8B0_9AGAM|nr:hypothetical protein Clacol_003113 [Clathrus columnatus]
MAFSSAVEYLNISLLHHISKAMETTPTVVEYPEEQQLVDTAVGFTHWAQQQHPTIRIVVCGGAAVTLWGGPRATSDLDVAIDFGTVKATTNSLKDAARNFQNLFLVGPKIFYKLDASNMVQVDFVDARGYFIPWAPEMITTLPGKPFKLEILTKQTLLIQKMITAQERNFPTKAQTLTKQRSDLVDFFYLLQDLNVNGLRLSTVHGECFPAGHKNTIAAFVEVIKEASPNYLKSLRDWNSLVERSKFDDTWKICIYQYPYIPDTVVFRLKIQTQGNMTSGHRYLGQQFTYNETSFVLVRLLQAFDEITLDVDA